MNFQLPNFANLPNLSNLGTLASNIPNPLPFLVDYRLTDSSLQVVGLNGSVVIRDVPYKDIVAVKRGYELWNEHWENRLDLWNSAVSIRLDRPLLPWFVVTPADPEGFVRDLSGRIGRKA